MESEVAGKRADLTPGTLYVVNGEGGWVYFGQVTADRFIGFFHLRCRENPGLDAIFATSVMSRILIVVPSIGRALRAGAWEKVGRFHMHPELTSPTPTVIRNAGTSIASVSIGGKEWETRIEDPEIQTFEIAAAWDAEDHLPARLTADYDTEPAEWHVGGPVWRQRRVLEEYARRFPEAPWHELPEDWVSTAV